MKISRFPTPSRLQVYSYLLSMPIFNIGWNYIFYGERALHYWRILAVSYPLVFLLGILPWYCHVLYDDVATRRYPRLTQTRDRIFMKAGINLFVMTPSILFIFLIYHSFHILGYSLKLEDLKYGYLIGLAINIIFETLWEVVYIIDKYRESAAETEMLEQMHLQQEFENLKQKVNPHFLFNCFNTLSSLISEDKEQAEKFLDELSKVYRYLLRNNESGISTVEQEMKFILSYQSLLKTRHGEGFNVEVDIDPEYYCHELPALSLQLLVENAVKHNVISKQRPITIKISSTKDAWLSVENNLVKKPHKMESTGIGLANIRDKYRLMRHKDIRIEQGPEKFIVSIPLIKNFHL